MIELCCEYLSVWCISAYDLVCTVHLSVCSYHVTYVFQSECTLYSCLNLRGTPCSKQGGNLKFN